MPETDSSTSEPLNESAFTSEMDAVRALIAGAISDLGVPLSQLVQSRFQDDDRLHRAALVLSAGYDERDGASYARIQLAAALEMLHLAMGIHQILVDTTSYPLIDPSDDQRSLIGSTILAGDFCFSRSAQMAASTDNPRIVAIFAKALQDASEYNLRQLFNSQNGPDSSQSVGGDSILLRSGAIAALELSGLPLNARHALKELSDMTIRFDESVSEADPPVHGTLQTLPSAYRQRWRSLWEWLAASSSAGVRAGSTVAG